MLTKESASGVYGDCVWATLGCGMCVCRGGKMMRAGQFFCSALLGGGDLLSHFRSTIGAVRFNFSVRNGKRWNPHAITTLVLFSCVVCALVALPLAVYKLRSLTEYQDFL